MSVWFGGDAGADERCPSWNGEGGLCRRSTRLVQDDGLSAEEVGSNIDVKVAFIQCKSYATTGRIWKLNTIAVELEDVGLGRDLSSDDPL